MVLNRKSPQEYPVNAGLPLASIPDLTLFRLCMIDLHDDIICNLAFWSNCGDASDLWQQLELASEL